MPNTDTDSGKQTGGKDLRQQPYLRLNEELHQVLDEWCVGSPLLAPLGPEGSDGIIVRDEEPLVQEVPSCLGHSTVGRVHQLVHMLAVLVGEDVTVVLEDGYDQPHCLHCHIVLLVQCHSHYAVLKLAGEELEFALQLLAGIERLQCLETLEPHIPNLVVQRPADVFQVRVIQEILVELLHPQANLRHTDGADLRQSVPVEGKVVRGKFTSHNWRGFRSYYMGFTSVTHFCL